MVARVALTMDSITKSIATKQEPLKDTLPQMAINVSLAGPGKRRASKSRQTARMGESRSVSPQGAQQLLPNGWMATFEKYGKRAKSEAPKFLLLLYEILDVESSCVIRWSEDGLALQILDPLTVTEQILPKYFNHTNFHSFQRQLNYFGFRKWTKSKTDICTFSHPFFRENQPQLLQLIKRKKAPRRTPANGASNSSFHAATTVRLLSENVSDCAEQKALSVEGSLEGFTAQNTEMHIKMNAPLVSYQPAINGVPLTAMTTPHSASSTCPLTGGLTRQYLPELNNVISPVAATECKKKAKKLDKIDYLSSATIHVPLTSSNEEPNSQVHSSSMGSSTSLSTSASKSSLANSDKGYAAARMSTPIVSLPTLNIVRSRLFQRQNNGSSPERQQQRLLQHQQCDYNNGFPGHSLLDEPQNPLYSSKEHRPGLLTTSLGLTSVTRADPNSGQSPVYPSSFNDPVNILLRIKKSRASTNEGNDVIAQHEQGEDHSETLASLHNYLVGNSLYTNRLQAQLKCVAEENEYLKQLLDTKQREIDTLQGQCNSLQQESLVLLEEKKELFDINRDLLSKLFPQ